MSENRFKRAREQVDFVHDINSDTPKTDVVEKVITRNKNEVVIEPNNLTTKAKHQSRS